MAKDTRFPRRFWDDPISVELQRLGADHLWVFLHLSTGPISHVTGLMRISVAQIGEDTGIDTDRVRVVLDDLANLGWCEIELPYLWIRGIGNINDKLGSLDFRRNIKWKMMTLSYLDSLPQGGIVERFRRYHGLIPDPEPYGIDRVSIDRVSIGYLYPSSSSSSSSSPDPAPGDPSDTPPRGRR